MNWRKNNAVIHDGKLLHFGPENGVYVYFRYTNQGKVMVILNKNAQEKVLDMTRYAEMVQPGVAVKDILADKSFALGKQLPVAGKSATILEIK